MKGPGEPLPHGVDAMVPLLRVVLGAIVLRVETAGQQWGSLIRVWRWKGG